ncbi:MAG: hypothetical protein HY286_16680 [Planctomycetes bacterium]|nr:hypothetical protein [Planctomycetota bacterium]
MRNTLLSAICTFATLPLAACGTIIVERPSEPRTVVVAQPVYEVPVFTGPGVEIIEIEPAPVERVYIYERGFPPGCYLYNNYYWYNGYRYEHDVFIERHVTVNIRENRYVNVQENKSKIVQIRKEHEDTFAKTGGRHTVQGVKSDSKQPVEPRAKKPIEKPKEKAKEKPKEKPKDKDK